MRRDRKVTEDESTGDESTGSIGFIGSGISINFPKSRPVREEKDPKPPEGFIRLYKRDLSPLRTLANLG